MPYALERCWGKDLDSLFCAISRRLTAAQVFNKGPLPQTHVMFFFSMIILIFAVYQLFLSYTQILVFLEVEVLWHQI